MVSASQIRDKMGNNFQDSGYLPGGYSLTNYSYTCMCRPTGSYFGDSDLKRGIIFKPFSWTGYTISNARKLQNIIGDLTVERGIKKLPIFYNRVSLRLQILSKTRSTFGGLGGTHPPKAYSSTPSRGGILGTNYMKMWYFNTNQGHLHKMLHFPSPNCPILGGNC